MDSNSAIINQLKQKIGNIEWSLDHRRSSFATGIKEIDQELYGSGIASGTCHEIISSDLGSSLGFTLFLLSSFSKNKHYGL